MNTGKVISQMIAYNSGSPGLINHALKVYGYARGIGIGENLDEKTQFILETAAILHDIGIRVSELKYGSGGGHYQEIEGPCIADELLTELNYPREVIDRVCYLIAHHHHYTHIDGIDYQILVEADFLVNNYEEGVSGKTIESVKDEIFKTETGKEYYKELFEQDDSKKSMFDKNVLKGMGNYGW